LFAQRVVRMNKTEDDELDAEELTEEELKQVAGACSLSLIIISHHKAQWRHITIP